MKEGKEVYPLIILNLLAIALIAIVNLVPSATVVRTVLAVPVILLSPGYAVCAALWPSRSPLSTAERLALSVALSLPIVSLVSLGLNFTRWGISLDSVLYTLYGFILVVSLIAWSRRLRVSPQEDPVAATLDAAKKTKRPLYLALALGPLIITAGLLGYVLARPAPQEAYTEFYILGDAGSMAGYPQGLTVGNDGRVTLVITNHEGQSTSYRIDVQVNGTIRNSYGPVIVDSGNTWEQEVSFIYQDAGTQKAEFLLYKGTDPEIYRSLYLLTDVK